MSKSYEEISKSIASQSGRPDANLANDSNHLGGIAAEDYATKEWVKEYHGSKESSLKQYVDQQDIATLNAAKEYTNAAIRNQDFSDFAELDDLQALNTNLTNKINTDIAGQKAYTDQKTQAIVDDVNANFEDVEDAIGQLNDNVDNLFQSVSSGKAEIAEAITDKGVVTSATASFETMADNIEKIKTSASGGGDIPEGYIDTSDATATASDILLGQTAYARGQKIYGTNTGIYIPSGSGTGGVDTGDATAGPGDISYGKTAYAGGTKITGTLQNVAVEEIFALNETETYTSADISGYANGAHNPSFPEGAEIQCSGIGAITDGSIYGLSDNQCRLVDFIKVKIDEQITRYIRTRVMDNESIVNRVSGDNQPIEKTVFSFSELGLNPDTDVSGISIGIDGFQGKTSHRALCINQGNKLHIYDYNVASNFIGQDPRDTVSYVGHWEVEFLASETGNTDSAENIIMACPVGTANCNPNIFAVPLQYKRANAPEFFLVILEASTHTSSTGSKTGIVYKEYSNSCGNLIKYSGQMAVDYVRFSANDNYVYGGGLEQVGILTHTKFFIAPINTLTYSLKNKNLTYGGNQGPVAIYNNDTMCIKDGYIYTLGLIQNVPTLTQVSSVKFITDADEIQNIFVSLDNKYCITVKGSTVKVYEIDASAISEWTPVQTISNSGNKTFNLQTSDGICISSSNLYRYTRGINQNKIAAIKYKNSYWYPTLSTTLSAGQGDVREGKTFIGWMGYPETGTMEE